MRSERNLLKLLPVTFINCLLDHARYTGLATWVGCEGDTPRIHTSEEAPLIVVEKNILVTQHRVQKKPHLISTYKRTHVKKDIKYKVHAKYQHLHPLLTSHMTYLDVRQSMFFDNRRKIAKAQENLVVGNVIRSSDYWMTDGEQNL